MSPQPPRRRLHLFRPTPIRASFAFVMLVNATACTVAEGELGQATLESECARGDSTCETTRALRPLPVGAELPARLDAIADGADGVVLELRPVSDKVVLDGGRMVAVRPGVTGVVAEAPDGTAVDFFHVWVAEADRLVLRRAGGENALPETLSVFAGEGANAETQTPSHLLLDIRAFRQAQEMGGNLRETWTVVSDNPDFIIMNEGDPGRRRLLLPADASTATLTVDGIDLAVSVTIEVVS